MKNHLKILWAVSLLTSTALPAFAQGNIKKDLSLGKIEPYSMEVTYDKTSHLIFPAAIRYVDLGSDCVIAGKAEDAQNVLRIKASKKQFEPQTNFSVITDDGRFYTFDVYYSPSPDVLSYDLLAMQKKTERDAGTDVLFEELGNTAPSLAGLVLQTIYKNNKRTIKHIGSESFGIQFTLKGIYIHDGKYYFHTQLVNQTHVPFHIDFISFNIADKKTVRRSAVQQKQLVPLRMYKTLDEAGAVTKDCNVFLLDQFTISDDKILLIEIFEKNGGRHQSFEVENSDLVKALPINRMHLKF